MSPSLGLSNETLVEKIQPRFFGLPVAFSPPGKKIIIFPVVIDSL